MSHRGGRFVAQQPGRFQRPPIRGGNYYGQRQGMRQQQSTPPMAYYQEEPNVEPNGEAPDGEPAVESELNVITEEELIEKWNENLFMDADEVNFHDDQACDDMQDGKTEAHDEEWDGYYGEEDV